MVVDLRALHRRVPTLVVSVVLLAAACSSAPEESHAPRGQARALGLTIEGNEAFSDEELIAILEEDLARRGEGEFSKALIDDLAFEIERHYRRSGYHFAGTRYAQDRDRAVIRVDEGPLVVIEEIDFVGNLAMRSIELDQLFDPARDGLLGFGERLYVENEVRGFAGTVEDAYLDRGFQRVSVSAPETEFVNERRGARIRLEIDEGPQFVVRSIDLEAIPNLKREEVDEGLAYLRESAYAPRLRFEVETAVRNLYNERGYPDAKATVFESFSEPRGEPPVVEVYFEVVAESGPAVRIRNIVVVGAEQTRERYIESRLALESGDLWNSESARRSFGQIFRTGLFRSVDVRLAPASSQDTTMNADGSESRDLLVEVSERDTLEYFFELGFGSWDLGRARSGVIERNLFGTGLLGRLEVLGSFRGGSVTLGLTDPWFARSSWTADLPLRALYREERSFTLREATAGLRFSRPLLAGLTGGVAYRFSLSKVDETDVDDARAEEERNLLVGALGPFLEFDSRDDILLPTRGIRSRVFVEAGLPELGGEIRFVHGGFTVSAMYSLFDGTVLAANFETEWIQPFDEQEDIPIQERLFNGGEDTVRSFQQWELGPTDADGDPRGGQVRNVISVELRQRIWQQLSMAVFYDWGNVVADAQRPFDDFRSGVGVGLRYALPIGPARLDFGINPSRRSREEPWAIHFAIGLPF